MECVYLLSLVPAGRGVITGWVAPGSAVREPDGVPPHLLTEKARTNASPATSGPLHEDRDDGVGSAA